jgi:hypothetical protein
MEDLNALYSALEKADAAGDVESAKALTKYIQSLPAEEEATPEEPVVAAQQPQKDLTQAPTAKPADNSSDFIRGLRTYLPETKATLSGAEALLGKQIGSEKLMRAGVKGYEEASKELAPLAKETDTIQGAINKGIGSVVTDFIPYWMGKSIGMVGEGLAFSAVGGLGGTLVEPGGGTAAGAITGLVSKSLVRKGLKEAVEKIAKEKGDDAAKAYIEKEATKFMSSEAGKKAVQKEIGSRIGIGAMAGIHGEGEVMSQAIDHATQNIEDPEERIKAVDDLSTGRLTTAAAGHALGDFFATKIGLDALDNLATPTKNFVMSVVKNWAITGAKEVPPELLQTALERFGADMPIGDKEAINDYINTAAASFGMSIVPGTYGGIRGSIQARGQKEAEKEIDNEPPAEEKRGSREAIIKSTLKDLEDKANQVNQAKAAEAARLKAAQQKQVVSEATDLESMEPVNPTALTETTLTSWGLSKNSKAFKTLLGQDVGTPEGRVLLDDTLNSHTGKINEQAVETYKSLLDQQKAEATDGTRTNTGATGVNDEVLGQSEDGTTGGTEGPNRAATNISGSAAELTKKGKGAVNAPLKRTRAERDASATSKREGTYSVDTEDVGPINVDVMENQDGSYALIHDKGIIKVNAEHAKILGSVQKMIEYYLGPFQIKSINKAEEAETKKPIEPKTVIDTTKKSPIPGFVWAETTNADGTITSGWVRDENVPVETETKEAKAPKTTEVLKSEEELTETKETKAMKKMASLLRTLDPTNSLIEALDNGIASNDDIVEAHDTIESLKAARKSKKVDLTKVSEEEKGLPQEARGEIQNTGETPASIESAFQQQYGKNVNLAKKRGLLNFLNDVSELPPEIGPVTPGTKAVFHKGKGYFIANRITKEDAPRMLLHEIGAHYGLEGMLGTNNYKRVVRSIKQNKITDKDIKAAWENTVKTYPEYPEGSDYFMQEVIARIGETAPNNSIFRQIVGYIKQFLSKLGYGWNVDNITADDIRDMVQHSVRVSLAGKVKEATPGITMKGEEEGVAKPTYYSQLSRIITNATFHKGATSQNADQWIDWIKGRKSEGIKDDEIEFSGIMDYLKMRGKDKIEKQELVNYLADNGPQVEEIKYGVDEAAEDDEDARNAFVEAHLEDWITSNYGDDPAGQMSQDANEQAADEYPFPYYVKEENVTDADGNKGYRVYSEEWKTGPVDDTYYFNENDALDVANDYNTSGLDDIADEIYRSLRHDFDIEVDNAREQLIDDWNETRGPKGTKYGHGSYILPGGTNDYAEIILRLKGPAKEFTVRKVDVFDMGDGWHISDVDTGIVLNNTIYNSEASAYEAAQEYIGTSIKVPAGYGGESLFDTFHWPDVTNPIAHYRVNIRMDNKGNRVLFVEEIQSDWAQGAKTIRKRHLRKLAKQYNIKQEHLTDFVPGNWGFKKNLSNDEKAAIEALQKKEHMLDNAVHDIRVKYREASNDKQTAYAAIFEAIKQNYTTSFLHDITQYLLEPEFFKEELTRPTSMANYESIKPVVEKYINNEHINNWREDYLEASKRVREYSLKIEETQIKHDEVKLQLEGIKQSGKLERGPWVQDTEAWSNLILKNIIRFAVDQGVDKVAFVNGTQAAWKGGRLEQFHSVHVMHNTDGTFDINGILDNGEDTRTIPNVPDEQLEEYLGSIADKVRELKPGEADNWRADLIRFPSKGMTEFYDNYIPRYLSKLLKKLGGGKLETISFEPPNIDAPPEQRIGDQMGFTVTQEMANKALQGQPLFARMSEEELDRQLAASGNKSRPKVTPPSFKDNLMAHPIQTIGEMVRNFRKAGFSFDHAINQKIMAAMRKAGLSVEELAKSFYQMQISQAVKSDQMADLFMLHGDLEYDSDSFKFVVKDVKDSMTSIRDKLAMLAKKHNIPEHKMYQAASAAFIARRSQGLIAANKTLKKRVLKLLQDGKKAQAQTLMKRQYKLVHLTPAEIKAGEKFFTDFKDTHGNSELEKLFSSWNKNRQRVLNFAEKQGLYSKEDVEELLNVMDYVPFYRDEQIEAGKGPKEYARGLLDAAADKRLKGSYQPVNNVFDNMERWTRYMTRKAINNRAAQEKIKLYSKWVPDDIKILGVKERSKAGNVVNVWQNGKLVKYEFQGTDGASMVDGFTGLEPVMTPFLRGALRPYANFLRMNIVLQPIFSIAQIPMDAYNAMFTSQVRFPLAIPVQVLKEIMLTPFGKSAARNYLKTTGTVGKHDFSSEYERIDIDAMKEAKQAGSLTKLIKMVAHPLGMLAMASDNVIRQAVYSQVMLETNDRARAVHMAEEIINFRRTGSSGIVNTLRQNAPFVNANLQSLHVAFSTLLDSGIGPDAHGKAFKRLITTGAQMFALAMIYAVLNADDDKYKKADTSEKDRYLFIPGTNGFKLPLRNDIITLLFKTLPEHLVNKFILESEDSEKMLHSLKVGLTRAIALPSAIPTLISPMVESAYNIDLNTGRPIVGRGQENLEEDLQYSNKYTMQLSRLMGDTTGTSPATIQHFFDRYFGTTSVLLGLISNHLIASMRGEILPEQSIRDYLLQLPSMNAFVAKEHGARNINDYYELNDVVQKIVSSANRYKQLDYKKYQEYLKEDHNAEIVNMQREMASISKELQTLRTYENQIYASKDTVRWTPASKKAELDRIEEMRQTMLGHQLQLKDRTDRYIQQLRYRGGL